MTILSMYNGSFSQFMHNASDEEHERFFMKVMEDASEDQLKIMEQAERIECAEQAAKEKSVATGSG